MAFLFWFTACDGNDDVVPPPEATLYSCVDCDTSLLVGTWRLAEFYSDPGDGSGSYSAVESDKEIVLRADSTWASNGNLCGITTEAGVPSAGFYSPAGSAMRVTNCDFPSIGGYSLLSGRLTISYACIEGCGERYRKIRD